jgi:thiopeptide-type bacteriocin biosynthesis protein
VDDVTYATPFFLLRAPLLPADVLLGWGGGLGARAAYERGEPLETALGADRELLRVRLRNLLSRPEVREAVFIASPSLDESLATWLQDPESERGQRVERACVRYVSRIAARPTPFGLFAGVSLGAIAGETTFRLGSQQESRRHTRLDNDYLFALVQKLPYDPTLRDVLRYRPNDSLWFGAGRGRYVEARVDGKRRSYHLTVVEETPELRATLARAAGGATRQTLADALVGHEAEKDEALAFVDELIASQVIVPELQLPVTGDEPLPTLVRELAATPATRTIAETLDGARAALAALDAARFAADPERYRAVARSLKTLAVEPALDRLFQVDLVRRAAVTLGRAIAREIGQGVALLHRIGRGPLRDPLALFRDAFVTRYEGRAVPLLEALDEEVGLGGTLVATGDPSPLLRDFPGASEAEEERVPWGKRQERLVALLAQALRAGAEEIVLGPEDVEQLTVADRPPLPRVFDASATVFAPSRAALARGEYRLHLDSAGGPPAGRLFGRFCHADPDLARAMVDLLAAEARHERDAIFAEVVHLPEGRLGNILLRPVLRTHELTYLGRSGAPDDRQIPASDLVISLEEGQLVLRSARLGRRVVPRLTTAHSFAHGLGVYRFLCLLQLQGVAGGFGWSWGPLETSPYLPRVRSGRLILSCARWRISPAETKRLGAARGAERFRLVQEWRARHRLPRWVALVEADNRLPVDLDNVLSIEAFVPRRGDDSATTLEEIHLGPDDLCVEGPDGRYTHELIVPFVQQSTESLTLVEARSAQAPARRRSGAAPITRRLVPGSDWLYAKLYTSPELADDVLVDEVGPVTRELLEIGSAEGWFFIRYGDPDWHVRWRLRGDPGALQKTALPAVQAAAARLLERGIIWRFQLDTYEREVERYGGPEGVLLSERLFQADSEAALEILAALEPGDAGLDERWRLALRGMGDLLADLGLDLAARRAWVKRSLGPYAKLIGPGGQHHAWASGRYRAERDRLEALFDTGRDPAVDLAPGLAALERRSERLRPVVAELIALEHGGQLSVPVADLARDYLHMHGFRVLRSAQNDHEPVLLDFLGRIYQGQAARASAGGPSPRTAP